MTGTPARTLEERVAALEELAANPLMAVDVAPFAKEQEADFREALDALGRAGEPFQYQILPPRPLLTPEAARELLRECVTVVRPGEVLAVRIPDTWSASDAERVQQQLSGIIAHRKLGISVLLLPGEEFAVAQPDSDEAFADRVERAQLAQSAEYARRTARRNARHG